MTFLQYAFLATSSMGQVLVPPIDDPNLNSLLLDPATIFYTEALNDIPRAYQHQNSVHSVYYNIAGKNTDPRGNGNLEYPWNLSGGLNADSNVAHRAHTMRFLSLPKDKNGKLKPIIWHNTKRKGGGIWWMFPNNTIVGEFLDLYHPSTGRRLTYQIRLRERDKEIWQPSVLQPYYNYAHLREILKEKYNITITAKPQIKKRTVHARHSMPSFQYAVEILPDLPQNIVYKLLTEIPFQHVDADPWHPTAPNNQNLSIVPFHNVSVIVGSTRESCNRCHRDTNRHVDNFPPLSREWYGRIRGSDGIFSWHPFSQQSISHNGLNRPITFRIGIENYFEKYDPRKHSTDDYSRIKDYVYE